MAMRERLVPLSSGGRSGDALRRPQACGHGDGMWPRQRLDHLRRAFVRPAYAWLWVSALGLAGSLALVRDEIASPAWQARLKAVTLLPHLSLAWWVAIWAVTFWVILFEGSYRSAREAHRSAEKRERELSAQLSVVRAELAALLGPTRDIGLGAATHFWCYGEWPKERGNHKHFMNMQYEHQASFMLAGQALRQLAADGLITVWGVNGSNSVIHVKIPAGYWVNNQADDCSLYVDRAVSNFLSNKDEVYSSLMVSRVQIESLRLRNIVKP